MATGHEMYIMVVTLCLDIHQNDQVWNEALAQ